MSLETVWLLAVVVSVEPATVVLEPVEPVLAIEPEAEVLGVVELLCVASVLVLEDGVVDEEIVVSLAIEPLALVLPLPLNEVEAEVEDGELLLVSELATLDDLSLEDALCCEELLVSALSLAEALVLPLPDCEAAPEAVSLLATVESEEERPVGESASLEVEPVLPVVLATEESEDEVLPEPVVEASEDEPVLPVELELASVSLLEAEPAAVSELLVEPVLAVRSVELLIAPLPLAEPAAAPEAEPLALNEPLLSELVVLAVELGLEELEEALMSLFCDVLFCAVASVDEPLVVEEISVELVEGLEVEAAVL